MDLREIGWEVVDWIYLAWVTGGNELSGSVKGEEFLG
jgi:hypothetical protein